MTKSEFVDQVATESGLGRARPARRSTPSSTTSRRSLKRGGEINFTGFGKFSVADRGARQGVNPQTGERIQIAASKVPRFSAGSALKKAVKPPSQRLQTVRLVDGPGSDEARFPASRLLDRGLATAFRRPARGARGGAPQPESCSGSTPTRRAVAGASSGRGRRRRTPRRAPGPPRRWRDHCRAAIEAAGPACVAVKLQLACFERLGAPGWDALEQTVAIARDHGLLVIADGKRGDVPVTARAYAQALVGETAGPVRRRCRAWAPTPSPPTRCSAATRSSRWSRPRPRPARAASCSSAPPTRARPSCRTSRRAAAARAPRAAGRRAGAAATRRVRPVAASGAVTGATRPELLAPPARADAARDLPAAGRRRAGRAGRGPRRRPSRRTPRRGWSPRRARS